jgi:quinol monooxygenase YgiN
MNTVGLLVLLEAKPGKEAELAEFLESGAELARNEPQTNAWFALRRGPASFAIFDAFEDESGRDAHLNGEIAAALMEKAPELLAEQPQIDRVDVLAEKQPG